MSSNEIDPQSRSANIATDIIEILTDLSPENIHKLSNVVHVAINEEVANKKTKGEEVARMVEGFSPEERLEVSGIIAEELRQRKAD